MRLNWINLTQDRNKWRTPTGFHKMMGISFVAEELLASQGLFSAFSQSVGYFNYVLPRYGAPGGAVG
jgi:hypothetical protein